MSNLFLYNGPDSCRIFGWRIYIKLLMFNASNCIITYFSTYSSYRSKAKQSHHELPENDLCPGRQ